MLSNDSFEQCIGDALAWELDPGGAEEATAALRAARAEMQQRIAALEQQLAEAQTLPLAGAALSLHNQLCDAEQQVREARDLCDALHMQVTVMTRERNAAREQVARQAEALSKAEAACQMAWDWLDRFGYDSPIVFGGEAEVSGKLADALAAIKEVIDAQA